jgi:hypothetical protein
MLSAVTIAEKAALFKSAKFPVQDTTPVPMVPIVPKVPTVQNGNYRSSCFNRSNLKTAEACGGLELDAELWQIDRGARLHMARRRLR